MATLYSIILAGGSGSRLWPMSREMFPKQMFKLDDEFSLFQKTFLNLSNLVDDKNIITTTSVKYASQIKEQLKQMQEKYCRKYEYKVLSEPIFRNTAPAIAMAVKYIVDKVHYSSKEPVILTVPSDQLIAERDNFSEIIEKGVRLAEAGYIVCFGSEANEVNENFGYIKCRKNAKISEIEESALKVSSFVEKPTSKEEKANLKGKFFINSGIYMFTPSVFWEELEKYSPKIYNDIIDKNITNTIPSINLADFEQIANISIDYAVMEKTKKLVTIPLTTEWKILVLGMQYMKFHQKMKMVIISLVKQLIRVLKIQWFIQLQN